MRKFLLASHGRLAEGLYNSLQIIMGNNLNILVMCAYVDENDNIEKIIRNYIESISKEDELIVVTDLFGGSVNNEFMRYLNDKRIHLISGMNLPLIIELITRKGENTAQIINEALDESKNNIMYCNNIVKKIKSIENDEF